MLRLFHFACLTGSPAGDELDDVDCQTASPRWSDLDDVVEAALRVYLLEAISELIVRLDDLCG